MVPSFSCECGRRFLNQNIDSLNEHRKFCGSNRFKNQKKIIRPFFKILPNSEVQFKRELKKTKRLQRRLSEQSIIKIIKEENRKLRSDLSLLKSVGKPFKESFYTSREWRSLRYKVLKLYGRVCMSCRASNKEIHVDHIVPRSVDPSRELDLENLQILCVDCNIGKGNTDCHDYRPSPEPENAVSNCK